MKIWVSHESSAFSSVLASGIIYIACTHQSAQTVSCFQHNCTLYNFQLSRLISHFIFWWNLCIFAHTEIYNILIHSYEAQLWKQAQEIVCWRLCCCFGSFRHPAGRPGVWSLSCRDIFQPRISSNLPVLDRVRLQFSKPIVHHFIALIALVTAVCNVWEKESNHSVYSDFHQKNKPTI